MAKILHTYSVSIDHQTMGACNIVYKDYMKMARSYGSKKSGSIVVVADTPTGAKYAFSEFLKEICSWDVPPSRIRAHLNHLASNVIVGKYV
jgi:hypothetical protein